MNRDGSTGDMERIQRGLEEFLQRQMQEKRDGEFPEEDFPNDEEWEEEFPEYDYVDASSEDWDSKEHIARTKARKKEEKEESRKTRNRRIDNKNTEGTETKGKRMAKKKKKRKKSGFVRILIIILLFLAILLGGLYYIVGMVYDKMEYHGIEALVDEPVREDGVTNILLIGNDSRTNGEDGRSDAMILLSISSKTRKIYMTSLLRDMYVEIPGYKGNRLNAAYSYGGAELLMDTIEENLGITVNRYVLVNFEAFANLVDAVGGIELELSGEEIEYVNAYLWEYNILTERPEGTDYMDPSDSGMVHLNGAQALAYSRNRYMGTDFGRTERQRKVLGAVFQKAPKALLTNPKELINGFATNLTTNLTKGECFNLCLQAIPALGYDMEQSSIPLEGTYQNATIRDMAVLEVDYEANKEFIRENIYGEEQ